MKSFFKKVCIALVALITLSSMNTQSQKQKKYIDTVKFMYSGRTYAVPLDEKMFWHEQEMHVKFQIPINRIEDTFIEDIKKLPSNKGETFNFLNYAFIYHQNGKADTIYSDGSLKTFYNIKNNQKHFYYDKEGKIADILRMQYSYFKDCW